MTYMILDSNGTRIDSDYEYDTRDEALSAVHELAETEADNNFDRGTDEWCELREAVREDLYIAEVS